MSEQDIAAHINPEQAAELLADLTTRLAGQSGFVELRSFPEPRDDRPAQQHWLPLNGKTKDLDAALAWCRERSLDGYGIYLGFNPRPAAGKGKKEHITSHVATYVDCDIYKTDRTKEDLLRAVAQLKESYLPTYTLNSGGGMQLVWINAPAGLATWEQTQEALYRYFKPFGADRSVVTDTARVLRLPGFPNLKQAKPRPTALLDCRFEFSDRPLAGLLREVESRLGTDERLTASGNKDKKALTLPEEIAEGGTAEYEGRNDLLFRTACKLRDLGFGQAEIEAALVSTNGMRCIPPLAPSEVRQIVKQACAYAPTHSLLPEQVAAAAVNMEPLFMPLGVFRQKEFPALEHIIAGLHKGEVGMLQSVPNAGKAQPLTAKVLKADGTWTTMGALRVGDALASVDGLPSEVRGIFPQGVEQTYRITLCDGRSTVASGEHLWRVNGKGLKTSIVLTTLQMKEWVESRGTTVPLYLPAVTGDFGSRDEELPVDPWLLGVLLGDGGLSSGTPIVTKGDPELIERVRQTLGADYTLNLADERGISFRLAYTPQSKRNPLTEALRSLGLMGKRSWEKCIPAQYLSASRSARLELLRGLVDTDGYVDTHRCVTFSTTSEQLARDVQLLARSLGAVSKITSKVPTYRDAEGEKHEGRLAYTVSIRSSDAEEFVWLPRKKARLAGKCSHREPRLNIVSVEPAGLAETQCIAVSHPSRLYVTDDYIVTHNTTLMLNLAMSMACGRPFPPLFEGGAPRKVLYLDKENVPVFAQGDLGIMQRRNFDDYEQQLIDENLVVSIDPVVGEDELNLGNPTHFRRFADEIRLNGAELVIIDTLAASFQLLNESDNSEMEAKVNKPLKELGRRTGAAILVVHHVGKSAGPESNGFNPKLYRGRGASSLPAMCRLVLDLDHLKDSSRHEVQGHIVVHCAKIKGQKFDDAVFKLDFGNRWFGETEVEIAQVDESLQVLLDVVLEPMKRSDIVEAMKAHDYSARSADGALKRALEAGYLVKTGQGLYEPAPERLSRTAVSAAAAAADDTVLPFPTEKTQAKSRRRKGA